MKKYNLILLSLLTILSISPKNALKSYAETSETMIDKNIYQTSFSLGGTSSIGISMINKYFDSNILVVKEDDLYFLSITLLDNNALSDFYIKTSEYQSGILEEVDGKKTTYTITLTHDLISSDLNVTANVASMDKEVSFTLKPDLNSLKNTNEVVDDNKEYKALYVPTLEIEQVGEVTSLQNAIFTLPSVKAYFGENQLNIETKVISPSLSQVEVTDNKFTLEELGTYSITYKASTSLYKTNLGNDSYVEETINVVSSSTTSNDVKIEDINNVLNAKYVIQSQRIESGSKYEEIKTLLKDISENFEITDVNLISESGETITLDSNVKYYINTNPDYDRNKVKVYYLNNGVLEEISCSSYGRYITFEYNKVGTFIVLEPGVSSKVNLGLIISLIASGVIVLMGLLIGGILYSRHRRKTNKEN
jgi:hypothetical protein